MSEQDHIICAYEFIGNGSGKALEGDEIAKKVKAHKLAWVHLDVTKPESRTWLHENVDYLDALNVDALLENETRPRLSEHKDGMMIILRGVNMHEGAEPEDMISIRLWIDEHRIISTQRRNLMAVRDLRKSLENGDGPKNAADFLNALITNMTRRMDIVISDLDDRTDAVEEDILDTPDTAFRHEIIDIRKKAIILRRYIAPQKDVVAYLRTSNVRWLDISHKRQLQENFDRITRYVEDLDAIRERAQIVKDELANILADRMNQNMYVLSIVAAIFLPLGFLTGLLGINVGGMPGANSPIAFWVVCLLCIAAAGGLIAYFRKMKWL